MAVHYFNSLKETTHTFVWNQKIPSENKLYRTCLTLLHSNKGAATVVCVLQIMSAVFQQHPLFCYSTTLEGLCFLTIEPSRSHSDT
jgi:hypothetical protein